MERTMENKRRIVKRLEELLKITRNGEDIDCLEYVDDEKHLGKEFVDIYFNNGYIRRVNVHMDSGTALIRDVMRQVD